MGFLTGLTDRELAELASGKISKTDNIPPEESVLPGQRRVELLQQTRVPSVETFKTELETPSPPGFLPKVIKGGVTALKALPIPFEAVEGAGARVMQKLQEPTSLKEGGVITGEELTRDQGFGQFREETLQASEKQRSPEQIGKLSNFLGKLGGEVAEGVKGTFTGEGDVVQFGDTIRRLSATQTIGNEAAANLVGFSAAFAVSDPLVFKSFSKTVDSLFDLQKSLSLAFTLKAGAAEKIIPVAQNWVNASDDVVRVAGGKVDDLFKGQKALIDLGKDKINRWLKFLPESVRKKLVSEDARRIFGIKLDKAGKFKTDAPNVWRIRKFLDDIPTQKDFITGASNKTRESVVRIGNKLRPLLSSVDSLVDDAMSKYSNIIRKRNFIRGKLIDKSTGFVKEGAKNILRQFQTKAVLREMSDIIPETADLVRTITGVGIKEAFSKGAKSVARTAATIGLIRGAFRGIGQAGDSDTKDSGGGS